MRKALLFLVLALPLLCHAAPTQLEIKADKLRNAAMSAFEKDRDQKKALQLNAAALKLTHHLPETSWRTIENYDDAGLYYYESSKWKASARHQAIAVLLACGMEESKAMLPLYVKRLGFAFSKYRPNENFSLIAANPLILLKDIPLNLRANADLRKRYFKAIKLKPVNSTATARYLYKLKSDAIPATCYLTPDQTQEQAVKSE
ncbi:MAG: hypothetical protein HY254_14275 [Burkholderiales bacterium]|nr:hypothetical protein [Burkholderiales bacterium]